MAPFLSTIGPVDVLAQLGEDWGMIASLPRRTIPAVLVAFLIVSFPGVSVPDEIGMFSSGREEYTWVRRGLGIAAVTFGALGATMTGLAAREFNKADGLADGLRRQEINAQIDRYNIAAITMYALAGTAFAAYLVWTLWPEENVEIQILPSAEPRLQVTVWFW
jgi:hypothetical protein